MNLVVWNISFSWNVVVPESFDFDTIETLSKTWDKNIYLFWETEIKTSDDFVLMCEKEIWKIINSDISLAWESKVELFPYDYEEEIYELVSFEWEDVDFAEIKERFKEHDAIFSIRESWISEKFWNKIIKADFIY